MTPRPILVVLAGLLATAACSGGPTAPTPVALAQEFTLAPGETASVAGTSLRVGFTGVTQDSRCPADVICVWPGEAVVALEVRETGGAQTSFELGTRTPEKRVGVYRIRLERVDPYPFASQPAPPQAYRVVLTVTPA